MNRFRRKPTSGTVGEDWKQSGSFVRKPTRGWLHPDYLLQERGVMYELKYVGAVQITQSMRNIPFDERGQIVRDAIALVCNKTGLIQKKRKMSAAAQAIIGEFKPEHQLVEVAANISTSSINLVRITNGQHVCTHKMETISFASMGEDNYKDMIGYVAKNSLQERACFVLYCTAGLGDDIIHTIGQAFELKYKEFLNNPVQPQSVVGRFTDPIFENEEPSSAEYTAPAEYAAPDEDLSFNRPNRDASGYSHLNGTLDNNPDFAHFNANPSEYNHLGDTMKMPTNPSEYNHLGNTMKMPVSEYNHLHQASQEFDTTDGYAHLGNTMTGKRISSPDFSPGDSFGLSGGSQAAVYDNPINSPAGRRQLQEAASMNSASIYDNPTKIIPGTLPREPANSEFVEDSGGYLTARRDQRPPVPTNSNPDYDIPEVEGPYSYTKARGPPLREIDREPWFHGMQTRGYAEPLIVADGDFLVRESSSTTGQFVLSGMRDGVHRHLLLIDPEGKVRTMDGVYDTVSQLIKHHKLHKQPIKSGGSDVYLLKEVHRR